MLVHMRQKRGVIVNRHGVSRIRRVLVQGAAASTLVIAGVVSFKAVAGANAANPDAGHTVGTFVANGDGSVTATLSGTWSWPGQDCAGRYGTGWAVDWWGISTSATPTNNFTFTDASIVDPPGTTTTGSVTSTGTADQAAHPLSGGRFFHVGEFYAGETANSVSTCTDTTSPSGSTASWTATATYPSAADVPPAVCVNMYDEHGSEGNISAGNAKDFGPPNDDNTGRHQRA